MFLWLRYKSGYFNHQVYPRSFVNTVTTIRSADTFRIFIFLAWWNIQQTLSNTILDSSIVLIYAYL